MPNPYSSPVTVPNDALSERERKAMELLSRPAAALLVLSLVNAAFAPALLAWSFVLGRPLALSPLEILIVTIQFPCLIAIVLGARSMRSLRGRRLAYTGALLACIPVLSPFVILGIPFGVWSASVLSMPAVRVAFDAKTL